MSLMRPFSTIREDLNRIFNEMDQEFLSPWLGGRGRTELGGQVATVWAPAVDVIEAENEVQVKAQVPGIRPEELDIEVENNMLTLSGEHTEREEETRGNVYRKEICYGKFFRRVPLPTDVDPNKADARFENGMLTVRLPKSAESRRHKIKVQR